VVITVKTTEKNAINLPWWKVRQIAKAITRAVANGQKMETAS